MIRRTRVISFWAAVCLGLLGFTALAGCDEGWGWSGDGYVEPADFSPYGYDYSMYDLFTSDL